MMFHFPVFFSLCLSLKPSYLVLSAHFFKADVTEKNKWNFLALASKNLTALREFWGLCLESKYLGDTESQGSSVSPGLEVMPEER